MIAFYDLTPMILRGRSLPEVCRSNGSPPILLPKPQSPGNFLTGLDYFVSEGLP